MRLDREINSMRLTSMLVNIHVLNKEKDKLSDHGQMNLEMLEDDLNKHIKELQKEQ